MERAEPRKNKSFPRLLRLADIQKSSCTYKYGNVHFCIPASALVHNLDDTCNSFISQFVFTLSSQKGNNISTKQRLITILLKKRGILMRKKLITIGLVTAMLAVSICGCSDSSDNGNTDTNSGNVNQGNIQSGNSENGNSSGDSDDSTATGVKFEIQSETVEENGVTVAVSTEGKLSGEGADSTIESTKNNTIYLEGDSVSSEVTGVTVDGGTATITKAGTYIVTGTIDDGQILVDTEDKETVWIILCNADITSKTNSPIYVLNAKKAILSAATGTDNKLTDAKEYTYADEAEEEPNACIFSKDDLVISGDGKLSVIGNFNNGIESKDTLEINDINLTVSAKNNGIKGKDYLVIKSGDISVEADGDGLKSDNTSDAQLGYILVVDGNIKVTSGEDGMQAETCLKITGGNIDIETGEGAKVASTNNMWGGGNTSSDTSIKGIKAGVDVTISGGDITINSEDDAIHTNASIQIDNGNLEIAGGDDGLHSDTELVINGGTINITKSYEGLESSNIIVNDGHITLVASDDGINAAGGNDGSAQQGRPGMNNFSSSTGSVEINGGYIYMNASGDGLDSNGTIVVTDGTILIDGPENNGNGALDYGSSFNMSGGLLVAAGSSGMMQTISASSEQNCISTVFASYQSADTLFNISDSEGNSVLTYKPSKKYNSVVVCSPDIKTGETYSVSYGGETTGEDDGNGLYTGGNYSGGTEEGSVTVSSVISTIGSGGMNGQMPGGMPGDMPDGNGNFGGDRGEMPGGKPGMR